MYERSFGGLGSVWRRDIPKMKDMKENFAPEMHPVNDVADGGPILIGGMLLLLLTTIALCVGDDPRAVESGLGEERREVEEKERVEYLHNEEVRKEERPLLRHVVIALCMSPLLSPVAVRMRRAACGCAVTRPCVRTQRSIDTCQLTQNHLVHHQQLTCISLFFSPLLLFNDICVL